MLTYLIRRLILIIPTLIGITFLVFLLLASAPGGIGAALQSQAGGERQAASAVALQEAYLQDRYGLDDWIPVQYIRWLSKISPVKFGQRDQMLPTRTGREERISPPKAIKEPPLWEWSTEKLPAMPEARRTFREEMSVEERSAEYQRLNRAYMEARYGLLAATTELKSRLVTYAEEAKIPGGTVTGKGKKQARVEVIRAFGKRPEFASFAAVEAAGRATIPAYAAALQAFADIAAFFRERPFDEDGIGISGFISLAVPDMGTAFSKSRPVIDVLWPALKKTLSLNLVAIPIIYLIAVPSGLLAAVRKGSVFDAGLGTVYIALFSFPVLLAGVLSIGFLANRDFINLFPVGSLNSAAAEVMTFFPSVDSAGKWQCGWLLDRMWHMCLPIACLVYPGFAILSKQTRAAMLENFTQDYVRTAKAKGVAAKDVVLRHVFRNSLLPLITIFVTVFPSMLAGSIIVEKVFSIQGMGFTLLDGISNRDAELILANTVMVAGMNLMALLLADVLYALADPRVTYE